MLQINDEAVEALRQIGDLHIRGIEADGEVELEIEEAEEPGVDDQLVERDGVKVYLDPVAASALEEPNWNTRMMTPTSIIQFTEGM